MARRHRWKAAPQAERHIPSTEQSLSLTVRPCLDFGHIPDLQTSSAGVSIADRCWFFRCVGAQCIKGWVTSTKMKRETAVRRGGSSMEYGVRYALEKRRDR